MNQFPLFSSGQELANLVINSGLLHHSWGAILATYDEGANPNVQQSSPFHLKYKVCPQSNCTIIAFIASPVPTKHQLEEGKELISSVAFEESFPLFKFLCTNRNPSFSIHKDAITFFAYFHNELLQLKAQCSNTYPLIITGHSLGGSIASLFTLWLLENINGAKRPLCITFGAPLLGDNGLQQAIAKHSAWNSCFLHVAANQDPVPRLFAAPHNPYTINSPSQTNVYKPFGTYLLCSEMGSTYLEDPEAISELLVAMGLESTRTQQPNEELPNVNYGMIVECLKSRVIFKGTSQLGQLITDSLQAGISLQLEAIGVRRTQQQQQNSNVNNLITKMKNWERISMLNKKQAFDPSKKLNEIKIKMVQLEWYKKISKKEKIGYYDRFKHKGAQSDLEVVKHKVFLTQYWKKMVEEAEQKPQKEGATFRTRWLFGGNNYRRMIEPLDIAEYYEKGQRYYKTNGRSQHYIKLEQWLAEELISADSSVDSKKQNVEAILTEDSCFWAHVEEALISCRLLKNGDSSTDARELWENLIKFEEYVLEMIKNYAVSPEIFLEKSSFMKWWKEYEEITRHSYNSRLGEIMRNGSYRQYARGLLVLT